MERIDLNPSKYPDALPCRVCGAEDECDCEIPEVLRPVTTPLNLPTPFILEEIAETKLAFTYKQYGPEMVEDFKNARQSLRNYEDMAILV